jgi:group I intron endonuclease
MEIKKFEKLIGIYKITNPLNKIYIGESIDIETRFKNYKLLRCKNQQKIHSSFLKYGIENHTFEIVEICDVEELKCRERYWQDFYEVLGEKGLNLKLSTCGEEKTIHSEETKLKIKKANTGRKHTQETKDKLSILKTGIKRSEESKTKQSNTMKGIIHSEESIRKMSESSKGRVFSDETRKKMSIAGKNKIITEETKTRMSNGSKGENNGRSIKVIDIKTGIIYCSITECAIDKGIDPEYFRKMLSPKSYIKNTTDVIFYNQLIS